MNFKKITEIFKNTRARNYAIIVLVIIGILVPVIKRKIAISREKTPGLYPVVVNIVLPKKGVLKDQQIFLGFFKPENQAAISSRISARVSYIAEEGTLVKEGDVVVQLDTTDLAANVDALKIKKENQEKIYNRDKILFDNGAISQEQLENSQNLYYQAVSAYESAVAQLSYGVIKAPFDAVVGKRYIQPGETALPGKVLLQLDGTGPDFEVYSDLPVETAAKIKIGSEHQIEFNGGFQTAWVKAIVPATANNLMTVKLKVKGNKLNIPPSTYVDVHFYTSVASGWIVPVNSVLHNMNGYFALTIKDDKVHWIPVKVLGSDGVNYCIEGLPSDVKLGSVSEQQLLKIYEGQKVKTVREGVNND
jgi:RND family efflux transporter MFP subunit